jgi:tRNA pseudouridine55 synthase
LVDKPAGCTSHDVVQAVRWALRERAVGHTGTLDPPATGLLVLCVGAATRLVPWLGEDDKRYRARVVLGRATTTGDGEGDTIATAPCDEPTLRRAAAELAGMTGVLELAPPAISAIKIGGRPAHARVRAGEAVAIAPRPMRIDAVTDVRVDLPRGAIEATLDVGKGTYVRSIAVELGARVGVPAHLGALRRLRVGRFDVDDPRAIGGLCAVAMPERAGGKPRRAIAFGDEGRDREAIARRLVAALVPVALALPEPRLLLAEAAPALDRLALGQSVDRTLLPGLPEGAGFVAAPGVVARVEVERGLVRPRRIVRLDGA